MKTSPESPDLLTRQALFDTRRAALLTDQHYGQLGYEAQAKAQNDALSVEERQIRRVADMENSRALIVSTVV